MLRRMRFHDKWCRWIRGCLKSSSVFVLVNGSPTSEFNVFKGLRRGDPMTPFLFNFVAEGLYGMMREAIEKELYTSYLVGDDSVQVNLLQYTNDIIFIGESTLSNIFTIKNILRCFEFAFG